jgi:hypothetical protein
MGLPKLKKLNPSSITSAQWSLFRIWQLKKEETETFYYSNTIAQFTNAWSNHRGFYK